MKKYSIVLASLGLILSAQAFSSTVTYTLNNKTSDPALRLLFDAKSSGWTQPECSKYTSNGVTSTSLGSGAVTFNYDGDNKGACEAVWYGYGLYDKTGAYVGMAQVYSQLSSGTTNKHLYRLKILNASGSQCYYHDYKETYTADLTDTILSTNKCIRTTEK